jgi:Glycosyltransferase family 87
MSSSPGRLSKWLVRAALILNTGLAVSYIGLWVLTARQGQFWRADFSAYYTGWAIVRDGLGKQLYDLNLQTHYQQTILEGRSFNDGLLPFTYPPHMALYFSPMARLARPSAFMLWTLGECALLTWLLRLVFIFTRGWGPIDRWLAFSAILSLPAMLYNFLLGAFSLFILICLWQFYLTLRNGRDGQSGIWLAAGLIKPQNMLLSGFLLLAGRRWKGILGAAVTGILIFLTTSAVLGWRIWLDFLNLLRSLNSLFGSLGMEPTSMYNFKGLLTAVLGASRGDWINRISWIALAASLLLTLWIWRKEWNAREPGFDLRMAFTLLLGLFFNLYLFPQDSLLLAFPAILFYNYLRRRELPYRAYAAFVLCCPAVFLISEFTIGYKLGLRIPVLAMMILMVWMAFALWKESKHGSRAIQPGNPV